MNANKAITYSNKLCLHKVAMRVTSLSYEQFLCEALQVQNILCLLNCFLGVFFRFSAEEMCTNDVFCNRGPKDQI